MSLHPSAEAVFEEDNTGDITGVIYRCTLCTWAWRINPDMADKIDAITRTNNHIAEEHPVDETPPPADPFTAIAMAAASMHEMYVSLLTAGFTEPQAIYLVGQALTGGKGTPPA